MAIAGAALVIGGAGWAIFLWWPAGAGEAINRGDRIAAAPLISVGVALAGVIVVVAAWRKPVSAPPAGASAPRWRLVRISECRPAWVGVHPSTARLGAVPTADGWDDLPAYVLRDHDAELRKRLRNAAAEGGFVVLVGDSSVGKTRSLFEAVRMLLPDWDILLPDDADAVRAAAEVLPPHTVVWLDDTPSERYLAEPSEDGLKRNDFVRIFAQEYHARPIIVVDTLWRSRYQALTGIPLSDSGPLEGDINRDAREILALAGEPIDVADQFNATERERAAGFADADVRISAALQDVQFGFTQNLAGAPELIRRWRYANPYASAVITAAIDAHRLRVPTPLTRGLLEYAAIGYLTEHQRATAPAGWFDAALAYATEPGQGKTALLLPEPGDTPTTGLIAGYIVADYLQQYGRQQRFFSFAPAALWESLAANITDGYELRQLGGRAEMRRLLRYAEDLYFAEVRAGDRDGLRYIVRLLADREEEADLRLLMPVTYEAGKELARVLYYKERMEDLREIAATGHSDALLWLTKYLEEQGRIDDAIIELKHAATLYDGKLWAGQFLLPELLWRQGRTEELAALAAEGDRFAGGFLKDPYVGKAQQQNNDDDIYGDAETPSRLPQDQFSMTANQLRNRAAIGDVEALRDLARVLAGNGCDNELRALILATGSETATVQFGKLLQGQGRTKEWEDFVYFGLDLDGTIAAKAYRQPWRTIDEFMARLHNS